MRSRCRFKRSSPALPEQLKAVRREYSCRHSDACCDGRVSSWAAFIHPSHPRRGWLCGRSRCGGIAERGGASAHCAKTRMVESWPCAPETSQKRDMNGKQLRGMITCTLLRRDMELAAVGGSWTDCSS